MPSRRPDTGLHAFVDDTKGKPPHLVSAPRLDENFVRCMPALRGLLATARVSYTDEGWFIDTPPPGVGTFVLGAVNGQIQWVPTQDCDTGEDSGGDDDE